MRSILVPNLTNYPKILRRKIIFIGIWCSSVQHFQLQSSVQFVEIPIVWHLRNTSQFWAHQYNDMSIGCSGDTCWKVLSIFTSRLYKIILFHIFYLTLVLILLDIFSSYNNLGHGVSFYQTRQR